LANRRAPLTWRSDNVEEGKRRESSGGLEGLLEAFRVQYESHKRDHDRRSDYGELKISIKRQDQIESLTHRYASKSKDDHPLPQCSQLSFTLLVQLLLEFAFPGEEFENFDGLKHLRRQA
jgi:hypothetical protein